MAFSRRRTTRSAPSTNGLHDPDVDPLANPRAGGRRRRSPLPIQSHQRLIVNPFLGVFGLLIWLFLTQYALKLHRVELFFVAAISGAFLVFLLEYHCVDCGRTGRLLNWKSHVCERVEIRSLAGGSRWRIWPSTHIQVVLWGFGITLGAVFILLSRW